MSPIILNQTQVDSPIYKLRDVSVRVNRNKRTVIRWELTGKIPPAKRNSDGERIYTDEDIKKILSIFREGNFYRRKPKR